MGGLVIVIEVGADLRAALSPTHVIEVVSVGIAE